MNGYQEQMPVLKPNESIDAFPLSFVVDEQISKQRSSFLVEPDYLNEQSFPSQVYSAEQFVGIARLEPVAIKLFMSPSRIIPDEVKLARELGQSPYFPDFIAEGEHVCADGKSRLYLATELTNAGTLTDAINGEISLSDHQRLGAIGGLALGLAELHDNDLVHRDVKPSNTGIIEVSGEDGDMRTVLLDLGSIATIGSNAPITYTEGFVDPMVKRGDAPIPAHDAYSLGKTLEAISFDNSEIEARAREIVKMLTNRDLSKRGDAVEAQGLLKEAQALLTA